MGNVHASAHKPVAELKDNALLKQLNVGMTIQEVEELLGKTERKPIRAKIPTLLSKPKGSYLTYYTADGERFCSLAFGRDKKLQCEWINNAQTNTPSISFGKRYKK